MVRGANTPDSASQGHFPSAIVQGRWLTNPHIGRPSSSIQSMTIAVTAPRMFAYQDWACVAVSLPWLATSGASCELEPAGREDARLCLPEVSSSVVNAWDMRSASPIFHLAHAPVH